MKKKNLLLISIIMVMIMTLSGCVKKYTGIIKTLRNYEITEDISIHTKSLEIEKALLNGDSEMLDKYLLQKMLSKPSDYQYLSKLYKEQLMTLDDRQESLYFKTDNLKSQSDIILKSEIESDPYQLEISIVQKEGYINMYSLSNDNLSIMQVNSYERESGDWKLTGVSIMDYKYGGMNQLELLNKVKSYYREGEILTARLYLDILQQLISNTYLDYKLDDEISKLSKEITLNSYTKLIPDEIKKKSEKSQIYGTATESGIGIIFNIYSTEKENTYSIQDSRILGLVKNLKQEIGNSTDFSFVTIQVYLDGTTEPDNIMNIDF